MPKDERSELGSNTDMQPALAFSQEPFKIATGVLQGMKDPFNAFAYRVEQAVKFRRVLLVLVGAFLRPNAISRERPDVCLLLLLLFLASCPFSSAISALKRSIICRCSRIMARSSASRVAFISLFMPHFLFLR